MECGRAPARRCRESRSTGRSAGGLPPEGLLATASVVTCCMSGPCLWKGPPRARRHIISMYSVLNVFAKPATHPPRPHHRNNPHRRAGCKALGRWRYGDSTEGRGGTVELHGRGHVLSARFAQVLSGAPEFLSVSSAISPPTDSPALKSFHHDTTLSVAPEPFPVTVIQSTQHKRTFCSTPDGCVVNCVPYIWCGQRRGQRVDLESLRRGLSELRKAQALHHEVQQRPCSIRHRPFSQSPASGHQKDPTVGNP